MQFFFFIFRGEAVTKACVHLEPKWRIYRVFYLVNIDAKSSEVEGLLPEAAVRCDVQISLRLLTLSCKILTRSQFTAARVGESRQNTRAEK